MLICHCAVKNQKELNPVVGQVLKQEMQPLFGADSTAATLNSEFLAGNSTSLPHIVAGYICISVFCSASILRVM